MLRDVNWKSVPWGMPGEAQRRPPWASTMLRHIDSPMPMPVDLVVNNGSKMRLRMASSIPVPESLIVTSTLPASPPCDADAQDAWPVGDGAHRIGAVHDEVHDDLLKLNAVAQRRRKFRGQDGLDRDAAAAQRADCQREHLADGVVDIECDVFGLAMPEKRPDAPDHLARAVALLDDALERGPGLVEIGRGVREPTERGIAVGDHGGERLIDLVGDRCREFAHRRQPRHAREFRLRLVHRRSGAHALGFVHRYADVFDHLAGLLEHRLADAVNVLDRSVAQHRAKRNVVGLSFRTARSCLFERARSSG